MGTRLLDGWWAGLLLGVLGSVVVTPSGAAYAQATPATARLTIVVRDAAGQPLRTTRMELYEPQPPAPPRGVAQVLTDDRGRVTIERLDPSATYVAQFHGGAWIIVDGQERGFVPIQAVTDQNAGRELLTPDDVPGFPVHLGAQTEATVRFVIGGTFSAGELVAAVPMIDLAASDDAAVRPVNPLTGAELTPEEARTFHAVIGQPWWRPASTAVAEAGTSGAQVADRLRSGADAAPGVPSTPASTPRLLIGVLLAMIGGLVTGVAVLLVRQRERT